MRISLKKFFNKLFMGEKVVRQSKEESVTDYVLRTSANSEIAKAAFNVIDLGASFSELRDFILYMNDGDKENKGFELLLGLASKAAKIDEIRAIEYNNQKALEKDILEINKIFEEAGHPNLSPTFGL